ncbi:MAG TPA: hypothetical protein PLU47_13015 [Azonexus sp.]|nr:hypothetical protein [Azonexus sp.]
MKVVRTGWLLLSLLAAGCAELGKQAESGPESGSTASGEQKIESQPLKYLKNRNLKPQPTRPLNVRAKCSTKDAIGTVRRLDLLVKEASVQTFDAQVTMKEYGACRFNLRDFEQVEKMPQALLRHRQETGCTVRMWEQGNKVTIAFDNCPKSCEGDAFSYLWPLIVEGKSGRC